MDRGAWQATVQGVAKESGMIQQLSNNGSNNIPGGGKKKSASHGSRVTYFSLNDFPTLEPEQ